MESSQRDLFIDLVVNRFIFKDSQITLSPCFAFIPEGLPKTGDSFLLCKLGTLCCSPLGEER